MKNESMGVDTPISKKGGKELLHETKEINALDVKNYHHHRTFSHLDMWDLQKRQRSAYAMRRKLM